MIYSMTGFGSGRSESGGITAAIEIKSVNHRYLDVHIKLPGEYQNLESNLKQRFAAHFKRGRFDAFVKIDRRSDRVTVDVNRPLVAAYMSTLTDLKREFSLEGGVSLEMISRIPGLVSVSAADLTAEDMKAIEARLAEASDQAFERIKKMRAAEGASLMSDIETRLSAIAGHLETIQATAQDFVAHYRQLLLTKIADLAPQLPVDSNRLEMEAILYAERCDIAEEITRLTSHLAQFGALRTSGDEAGKRMDFILQEMNREANTILSKTSGLGDLGSRAGQAAIEIRMEIEKLREQVQNIE